MCPAKIISLVFKESLSVSISHVALDLRASRMTQDWWPVDVYLCSKVIFAEVSRL